MSKLADDLRELIQNFKMMNQYQGPDVAVMTDESFGRLRDMIEGTVNAADPRHDYRPCSLYGISVHHCPTIEECKAHVLFLRSQGKRVMLIE